MSRICSYPDCARKPKYTIDHSSTHKGSEKHKICGHHDITSLGSKKIFHCPICQIDVDKLSVTCLNPDRVEINITQNDGRLNLRKVNACCYDVAQTIVTFAAAVLIGTTVFSGIVAYTNDERVVWN